MTYRVALTRTAVRQRRRLDHEMRRRIDTAIRGLGDQPRPSGATKLSGRAADWRIRSGDYRVLYEINDEDRAVTIWRIAHRREVYRGV